MHACVHGCARVVWVLRGCAGACVHTRGCGLRACVGACGVHASRAWVRALVGMWACASVRDVCAQACRAGACVRTAADTAERCRLNRNQGLGCRFVYFSDFFSPKYKVKNKVNECLSCFASYPKVLEVVGGLLRLHGTSSLKSRHPPTPYSCGRRRGRRRAEGHQLRSPPCGPPPPGLGCWPPGGRGRPGRDRA